LEFTAVKAALEKLGYIVDYASVDYLPLVTGIGSFRVSYPDPHSIHIFGLPGSGWIRIQE
jgi:hypothetical protein